MVSFYITPANCYIFVPQNKKEKTMKKLVIFDLDGTLLKRLSQINFEVTPKSWTS